MGTAPCIEISLLPQSSRLKASDGREVPFTRAILEIKNKCDAEVSNITVNVQLGQEGGTVQDVSNVVTRSMPASIPPRGSINLDVYDLLLPAHSGTASKIHMFGYRAALNWTFELAAGALSASSASAEQIKTPVRRWSLRWSVTDPSSNAVGLTIQEIKD